MQAPRAAGTQAPHAAGGFGGGEPADPGVPRAVSGSGLDLAIKAEAAIVALIAASTTPREALSD